VYSNICLGETYIKERRAKRDKPMKSNSWSEEEKEKKSTGKKKTGTPSKSPGSHGIDRPATRGNRRGKKGSILSPKKRGKSHQQ